MTQETLIPITEVCSRTHFSRTTVYRYINQGRFPKPVRIGQMSRWVEREIDEWIENLMSGRGAA